MDEASNSSGALLSKECSLLCLYRFLKSVVAPEDTAFTLVDKLWGFWGGGVIAYDQPLRVCMRVYLHSDTEGSFTVQRVTEMAQAIISFLQQQAQVRPHAQSKTNQQNVPTGHQRA